MWRTQLRPVRVAAFAAASAFALDLQAARAEPTVDAAVGPPGLDPYAFYVFARDDPRPAEASLPRWESCVGPSLIEVSARASQL